ncbi:hypothetical protein QFC21_002072 [Naganishia friedmannii]|uniref:Uncharacterized protein n=1 Tax=Naganishia friedmannii TaxID=89922 RepID=A0ACC2VYK8_9TREE|nr:hypothetical protein QFC21_002072 [Naganishia friedmannii]
MALRQSDSSKLENKLQPDVTKSTFEKNKQELQGLGDAAASCLPGQTKTSDHLSDHKRDTPLTHDTGRTGLIGTLADAVKPESSETLGDKASRHVDNGLSAVQPEHDKGVAQKVMDTVNPQKYGTTREHNHLSSHATTGEKPGVVASVTNAVKNTVKNTVNKVTGQGATHDCCAGATPSSGCGHATK